MCKPGLNKLQPSVKSLIKGHVHDFFYAQSRANKVKSVLDRTQSVVPPYFQETIHLRGTLVPGQPPSEQDGSPPPRGRTAVLTYSSASQNKEDNDR